MREHPNLGAENSQQREQGVHSTMAGACLEQRLEETWGGWEEKEEMRPKR